MIYHALAQGDIIRHTDGIWLVEAVKGDIITLVHIGHAWDDWSQPEIVSEGKQWEFVPDCLYKRARFRLNGRQMHLGRTLGFVPPKK